MKLLVTIFFIFFLLATRAQDNKKMIAQGNDLYHQQEYEKAEKKYRNVLEKYPSDSIAKFNLANSLIKQNNTEEAEKLLSRLETRENSKTIREKSVYNKAVIKTHQNKLEESIEGYKAALRLNPNDQEARENLQKALLELKKRNQSQNKNEEKNKEQPKPKLNNKQVQQELQKLEQKEKQIQERMQKNNSKTGNSQPKDW